MSIDEYSMNNVKLLRNFAPSIKSRIRSSRSSRADDVGGLFSYCALIGRAGGASQSAARSPVLGRKDPWDPLSDVADSHDANAKHRKLKLAPFFKGLFSHTKSSESGVFSMGHDSTIPKGHVETINWIFQIWRGTPIPSGTPHIHLGKL